MLTQNHLEEFALSGISKETAELIFRSVSDSKEIANFLGWQAYKGPPGWLYEGIDPITGKPTGIGQFKPDGGITFPDGKTAKYLSQKGSDGKGKYDACCLQVPEINWQEVIENISQPIRIVEGAKKAIASMLHTGIPTVALSGVDMATIGGRSGQLTPTIAKFAAEGRPIEIAYDADLANNINVRMAAIAFGRSLKKAGCQVTIRTWAEDLGKGIDDAIENVGVKEFERQSKVLDFDEWLKPTKKPKEAIAVGDDTDEDEALKKKPPAQSVIAKAIAEAYRDTLAWRPTYKKWYRYGSELEGLWSRNDEEFINRLISIELSGRKIEHSANYLAGVIKILKAFLAVKDWDSKPGLLPAKNGVIDLKTLKLSPHSPAYKLTWQLPYEYNPQADCKIIKEWLLETTKGDKNLVELLRAYMYSVIYSRTDIHCFLELFGPSGSGKGTFMKLVTMLVGDRNTHITKLKKLEGQFETAALLDKKLVLVTDSDRYGGSVETLKAITGGDRVPYEEKFLQAGEGFQPGCKVILSCNEPIQAQDYIALERRRISVPFDNKVTRDKARRLIEEVDGEMVGEFIESLPGLLNWVLTLPEETAEKYLKGTEQMVPGYKKIALEAIINTNPIADWANQHLIYEEGTRLQVGIAQRDKDSGSTTSYLKTTLWMYASFAEFCATTGTHLMSLKRFLLLANDLLVNQLKLNIRHNRDRVCAFFENLRLRAEFDDIPGLISGDSTVSQAPEVTPQAPEVTPQAPKVTPQAELPWQTFPSNSTDSLETRKNKARACYNQQVKAMKTSKNIQSLATKLLKWTKAELDWAATYLMSADERRQLQVILTTNQLEMEL